MVKVWNSSDPILFYINVFDTLQIKMPFLALVKQMFCLKKLSSQLSYWQILICLFLHRLKKDIKHIVEMMNFEDLKDSEKQEKKNSQNDPLVIITSLVTSCIRYFLQITLICQWKYMSYMSMVLKLWRWRSI